MTRTEEHLKHIYEDITRMIEKDPEAGPAANFFKGQWGALFYFFYYEQFVDDRKEMSVPLLEKLYNQLEIGLNSNFTYCNGLSGPFWLLQHLNKHEFIELDIQDIASDFITAAILQSNLFLAQKNFDFLHGAAGISNLLTEFTGRADVREHLEHFAKSLDAFSVATPYGRSIPMFYYHTDPPSDTGTDAFSLAHGTCSLQLILLKIAKAGIARDLCRKLIYESMEFILHHEVKGTDTQTLGALFPSSLALDGKPSPGSRVSWCYGDVNVAYSLWYCGKYYGEDRWQRKAIDIMYHNAKRNTPETAAIVDTCLCHGSGGNAAMFRRFWYETNDKVFYNCAEEWYQMTDKMLAFSDVAGKHGVKSWQGKDEQWQYCWDILDGSAGTGLALIGRVSNEPLPWDEFLLLS